ncbi:bacterial Ig-like domain-containing protein, partial [Listeria seeligeri]|uniref:bacterial Ig-like domain-containing protein n=1 Tax=Listeria seeligeri TaxID=1640 RepID=UPI00188744D2
KDQLRIGATNFTLEYKDALALTEAQAVTKAKTAAFEEVKNGVNSNAQDRTNVVKVDETQLKAIQDGPNQGGTYPLTYTLEQDSKEVEVVIQVKVEKDLTTVNAHDSKIYVGDSWSAADNFDSALNKEGETVTFADIVVTGSVDTTTAGTYPVSYKYNDTVTTVNVTVKDNATEVNAHDSTIYTGDTWSAKDNFDSARDKDGNAVTFADVTVEGTVDNTQAGTYPITYKYDGFSKTIQVSVKNPQTAIYAHDSVVYTGDTWTAKDNFDRAIDKAGNAVAYKDVTVEDAADVDLATPGTYSVTYRYAGISKVVQITVKPRLTKVESHDSTIYAGDTWQAKDNFDAATNKKGDNVKLADVTVTGQVDTQTPGTYEVTYRYDGVTSVSHVTVLQNHAKIIVHDSKLQLNGKWDAKDNFVSAMSRTGSEIPLSNVKVTGKVNTKKAGTYKVTYTIDPNEGTADAGKKELSVVANIQVVEKEMVVKGGGDPAEIKQRTATYREAIPRTGDQMNLWIVLLGVCLVGLALFLWINRQRRSHK